jgi:hypothetical protein
MKSSSDESLIGMRNNIIDLVDRSGTRFPTGNGRAGGMGQMFSYGHKTVTEKYASIRTHPGEKCGSASYNNLQSMIGLTKAISIGMAENMRQRHFEYSLSQIKLAERGRPLTEDHHILSVNTPCPELGSLLRISCKFFSTINFANELHYDPDDLSVTFAHWVERYPGTARNWYLVFPNMIVHKDGIEYKGLQIELCEGACVEWDGRIMKHCTTVSKSGITEDGKVNDVMAVAFVATRAKIEPGRNIPHLRDPRQEMNSNYKI